MNERPSGKQRNMRSVKKKKKRRAGGEREGRDEGGMKGKARGTCGRWNGVKNENHFMATQTRTHKHTLLHTRARFGVAGRVKMKNQKAAEFLQNNLLTKDRLMSDL